MKRGIWIVGMRVLLIVMVFGFSLLSVLLDVCYGLVIKVDGFIKVVFILWFSMLSIRWFCMFSISIWILVVWIFFNIWYLILFKVCDYMFLI